VLCPGSGQHILFIDDDPMQCLLAERMLGRVGYRVTTHSDPLAALADLQRRPDQFDVVFTNFVMPKVSGLELGTRIAHIRSNLPIILVTGAAPEALPPAFAAILPKPFDATQLTQAAARALSR
jgi:DNA-binding NtrC family response regulator